MLLFTTETCAPTDRRSQGICHNQIYSEYIENCIQSTLDASATAKVAPSDKGERDKAENKAKKANDATSLHNMDGQI